MTIKKGDTLYRTENGEPVKVHSVRAMPNTQGRHVRLYFVSGTYRNQNRTDLFDGKLPEYSNYSLTQTPELARLWADTLQERADHDAKLEQAEERKRLTRLTNRDRLNAPPIVSQPVVVGDEVRVSITTAETDRRTGEVEDHTSEVRASVYAYPDYLISEDGEHTHRMTYGVNWSALGTQSPAVARAYALAIIAAADLADARNATPTETLTDA